jgi:hypothetical protein
MDQCCPVCQGTISEREGRWVLNHGHKVRVKADIRHFFANVANMKYGPVGTALTTGLTPISQASHH